MLTCYMPNWIMVCLALLIVHHGARANVAGAGESNGTPQVATRDKCNSPDPGGSPGAASTRSDGPIFAWDLVSTPAALETATDCPTALPGGPVGAVIRTIMQPPQARPFWIPDRGSEISSNTSDAAGAFGLNGGIAVHTTTYPHFPHRGSDWVSTLQFTIALASLSLVAQTLPRRWRSDSLGYEPERAIAHKRRGSARGKGRPTKEIILSPPALAIEPPATG